ncbi:MAG: glutathione S-transferase family protein [Pseudomonadales bacterium]|nr:glutathione S-transferase family protein [Pseudomonadales bacterium]
MKIDLFLIHKSSIINSYNNQQYKTQKALVKSCNKLTSVLCNWRENMGKLVDGSWVEGSIISSDGKGAYARIPRSFRETISQDHAVYKPQSGRYHLYVSYACPWAHRTLIYRALKNLQDHITVSVVHPDMLDNGWVFDDSFKGATQDHLFNNKHLYEVYQQAQPDISTSVTVPILWDKQTNTIVNNESSEIIRIFNTAFNDLTNNTEDYYPKHLQTQIDELNEEIYNNLNNGVYRTGFAKTQQSYDAAVKPLFKTLDKLDKLLDGKDFLVGDTLTEADIRLVPTLLRFDLVYYVHFKCSQKRIADYKNLSRYTKNLYQLDAIKNSTNFEHIKRHYYFSHESINPYRIVPFIANFFEET